MSGGDLRCIRWLSRQPPPFLEAWVIADQQIIVRASQKPLLGVLDRSGDRIDPVKSTATDSVCWLKDSVQLPLDSEVRSLAG